MRYKAFELLGRIKCEHSCANLGQITQKKKKKEWRATSICPLLARACQDTSSEFSSAQITICLHQLIITCCWYCAQNVTAGKIQTEEEGEQNRRKKEIIQTFTWSSFPLLHNPFFFTLSLPLPSPTFISSLWPWKEKEVLKFYAQLLAKTPDSWEHHHLQSSAVCVSYSHGSPESFFRIFPLSVLETQMASKSSKLFKAYLGHSDRIIHCSHMWLCSPHQ